MRNTFIDNGNDTFDDMITWIDLGFMPKMGGIVNLPPENSILLSRKAMPSVTEKSLNRFEVRL